MASGRDCCVELGRSTKSDDDIKSKSGRNTSRTSEKFRHYACDRPLASVHGVHARRIHFLVAACIHPGFARVDVFVHTQHNTLKNRVFSKDASQKKENTVSHPDRPTKLKLDLGMQVRSWHGKRIRRIQSDRSLSKAWSNRRCYIG